MGRGPDGGGAGYAVRPGLRWLVGPAALLAVDAAVCAAALRWRPVPVALAVGAAVAGAAATAVLAGRIRAVRRGTAVLVVDGAGVTFGATGAEPAVTVPWSRICAVELFTERVASAGTTASRHRCVGVRTPVAGPGGGPVRVPPGARLPAPSERLLLDAGRPDLVPGRDGTYRAVYRRTAGWRVDRHRLEAAVRRHAPHVPVVDGPPWPPVLGWADAMAAGRVRRTRRAAGAGNERG